MGRPPPRRPSVRTPKRSNSRADLAAEAGGEAVFDLLDLIAEDGVQ